MVGDVTEEAVEYGKLGWWVLPVRNKKPLVKWDRASSWEDEIRHLWNEFPGAEVGVLCGPSGLAVLDVDTYKGGAVPQHISTTWTAVTPRGGQQLIYTDPTGMVRNTVEVLGTGLDTRGPGGMFVAPSSASEGRDWLYRGVPVAKWPETLTAACRTKAPLGPEGPWKVVERQDLVEKVERLPNETCPAHQDRNPSLGMMLMADGTVWPGCWSGCLESEVLEALVAAGRYDRSDLYPPEGGSFEAYTEVLSTDVHGNEVPAEISDLDLALLTLPEIKWIVPDLLPEGLTILGGKPKVGKSWMALDLALSVALGREFLGTEVECGDVLYLALEDNLRRVQSRSRLVRNGDPAAARLAYRIMAPRLGKGLEELLVDWLDRHPEARLIVIDTLGLVRPPSTREEGDGGYEAAYNALSAFKTHTDARGVGIVVVHHQRKAGAEDPLDTLAGSVGIAGAADTILVLRKEEDGKGRLQGRGRDVAEVDWDVWFDEATHRWSDEESEDQAERRDERDHQELVAKIREKVAKGQTWRQISNGTAAEKRNLVRAIYTLDLGLEIPSKGGYRREK